ncbi:MAG: T9SS type A sorting domain-containing protein [Melioribacteraceae bacterium]
MKSFCFKSILILIIFSFTNLSAQTESVNITFKVDMSLQKQLGTFKPNAPDNNKVYLKGTFNGGWEINEMTLVSGSTDIYEKTLSLPKNSTSPFKFFINTDETNPDIGIWEVIPGNVGLYGDRLMFVRESDISISPIYFNNLTPNSYVINPMDTDPHLYSVDSFYETFGSTDASMNVTFNSSGQIRGAHKFEYSVKQTESWGGNAGIGKTIPGSDFFNLSKAGPTETANTFSFYINVDSKATFSDRTVLYISLYDMSENPSKEFDYDLAERWDYNLDISTLSADPGWTKIEIPFSRFSIPDWISFKGNGVLNPETIKKYDIGVNLNGRDGGIGVDITTGSFSLDNFAVERVEGLDPVSIHFKVDMRGVRQQFKFDPIKDHVLVRGEFNFWTEQDTLFDLDGDLVYEGDVLALPNGTYGYKFFTDSPTADNSGWESNIGEDPVSGNRLIVIGDINIEAPLKNFNEVPALYTWANYIRLIGSNNNIQMLFGTAATATDGQDAALGEIIAPPPPPESDAPDLKFQRVGYDDLINDFRPDTQESIEWKILFQGPYPITLKWDKTAFPEGSFRLKDVIGGTFINLDMKSVDSVYITNNAITKLAITFSKTTTININIAVGWNIASIPLNAADMSAASIFEDNITSTWKYDNGYTSETTIETGKGYWIKYNSAKTISVVGLPVNKNTVAVKAGWNIIAPYETEIIVTNINTTPAGIILSSFFSFEGQYKTPTSLKPGMGYWIKVQNDGVLNLNTGSGKISENHFAEIDNNWTKIIVSDRKNSTSIYLADKGVNTNQYELPPLSPAGNLDVRFDSEKFVETLTGSARRIKITSEEYPVTLTLHGTDLKIRTNEGNESILRNGEKYTINNPSIRIIEIEPLEIPVEFTLMQNYPNPFNPETTIKFGIPENSDVTLSIFNTLGEKVADLVKGEMEAGYHTVNWHPTNMPSGMYIYRITTNKYTQTKKLIFLK